MAEDRPFREIQQEELARDPAYQRYWEETALARLVAIRLIAYRADHGLTQTQLAHQLGLRQPHVSRLELGERTPSLDTLRLLSAKLGISFHLDITPSEGQSARLQAKAS